MLGNAFKLDFERNFTRCRAKFFYLLRRRGWYRGRANPLRPFFSRRISFFTATSVTRQRERKRDNVRTGGRNPGELVNLRAAFLRWMHISSAVRGPIVANLCLRGHKRGLCAIHRVRDYQCDAVLSLSLFPSSHAQFLSMPYFWLI